MKKLLACFLLLALCLPTLAACDFFGNGGNGTTTSTTESTTAPGTSEPGSSSSSAEPSTPSSSSSSSAEPSTPSSSSSSTAPSAPSSSSSSSAEPSAPSSSSSSAEPSEPEEPGTSDTRDPYTRDGDYIYFGEYPQTLKADSVTITSTTDSRGYYLGSDGAWYAKVTATPYGTYTFSTGASVTSGTVYYFKVEPIRWRILSESDGTALILCDSIIANKAYDDYNNGNYDNNYANSTIRTWLNATFYETAFTDLQQAIILTTTVDNSVASTGYIRNPYVCADTEDKVFLLSHKEVTNSAYGFSSSYSTYDTARRMQTSDYSRATGVYMDTPSDYYGNGFWWLRSPDYYDSGVARYVTNSGYAGGGNVVYNASDGVVPALQIRLSGTSTTPGTGTSTPGSTTAPSVPSSSSSSSAEPSVPGSSSSSSAEPSEPEEPGTSDTRDPYTRDGDYIYFGEYPQTLKADSVTITSTTDSRGYYLGSDGAWYAKVTATPYTSGYTFSTGGAVTSDTVYYFKVEPIRWRILSEGNGTALILCDSIIANHRYDDSSNHYAESEIRAWLNETFYATAFTDLQQAIILTTTVDNSVASTGYSSNPYVCADTSDKVFLLSYAEVTNSAYGFSSSYSTYDTARRMQTSDYSRATGAWMSTYSDYYGNGFWWLRSPYNRTSSSARIVDNYGYAGDYNYVYTTSGGVVPALQIRL